MSLYEVEVEVTTTSRIRMEARNRFALVDEMARRERASGWTERWKMVGVRKIRAGGDR